MDIYKQYSDFVGKLLQDGSQDLGNFKSHPDYTYMLEHVTKEQGEGFLEQISNEIPMDAIREYCLLNDRIGEPNKADFKFGSASPTSVRYVTQATVILSYMKSLNMTSPDVVEIGGGYGGMFLAMRFFSSYYGIVFRSYTIIDLTEPLQLQKIYLSKLGVEKEVCFENADTFGAMIPCTNMFLLSNYCFSEIPMNFQEQYRKILFPKVAHGFFAWNNIDVYDFGFPHRIETEVPLTAPYNRYVYF